MIAPIVVTVVMLAYYILYFSLLFSWLEGLWKYALGIIPAIGVVVKDNELIMQEYGVDYLSWSGTRTDVLTLPNYTQYTDAQNDFNGKANTLAIVEASTSDTSSNNAAIYCNSYSTEGTNAGEWYLPAAGELYSYVYTNYDKLSSFIIEGFIDVYWSSSEVGASTAWAVSASLGLDESTYYKTTAGAHLTCFRAIN